MQNLDFVVGFLVISLTSQTLATYYQLNDGKTFKKASELFSNRIKEKFDMHLNNVDVSVENTDLKNFSSELDSLASEALNNFDEYLEFGEDQKLIDAISKANEDDMDGLVEEE